MYKYDAFFRTISYSITYDQTEIPLVHLQPSQNSSENIELVYYLTSISYGNILCRYYRFHGNISTETKLFYINYSTDG